MAQSSKQYSYQRIKNTTAFDRIKKKMSVITHLTTLLPHILGVIRIFGSIIYDNLEDFYIVKGVTVIVQFKRRAEVPC